MRTRRVERTSDGLALAAFVCLGLPDGMLGTAWPSIRHSLHAPVGDLGLVLLLVTAGAAGVSLVVAPLLRRLGVARCVAAGLALSTLAAVGFGVAPGLGVLAGAAVVYGLGSGTLDSGINSAVGVAGRGRLLNLLHGFYGIGTSIGPLVVTAAVLAGSWRPAYAVLVVVDLVLALAWLRMTRETVVFDRPGDARPPPPPSVTAGPRRPRLATTVGIAVFFTYTGLEVSAGQWEATFGRSTLHLTAAGAGLATFGYWAALAVVRLGLGSFRRPPSPRRVVRVGAMVSAAATALIWWGPNVATVIAGFTLLGAALAGVFPALVALTPLRFGSEASRRIIAWQVGAAAAGGAGISAVAGLLVGVGGLGVLPPLFAALAVLLLTGDLLLSHVAPPAPSAVAAPVEGP